MAVAPMRAARKRRVVFLGPQRLAPTARDALAPLIRTGDPVAAITAGWEERETEHSELTEHLGREVSNLALFARAEDVFMRDPELHQAMQEHRQQLRALHQIYRLRLRHLAPAAEELLTREGPDDLLEPERESAFEILRCLDDHNLGRVEAMQREFQRKWRPLERSPIAEHRAELEAVLAKSAALCIAGGHVRILLTRLRLFDVLGLLPPTTPIVAWSAGAMSLTEKIVLFHDNPPQGRGYAEVLGPGLGICPGIVALPDASRRLLLEDPIRVQLLSRRFPGAICAALDEGTQLLFDGREWTATEPTMQLTATGELSAVSAGKGS